MATSVDSLTQRRNDRSAMQLLMVGCSANQADQFARALRNNGQAVHLKQVETVQALGRLLETAPVNLTIINADAKQAPKDTAIELIRANNPEACIILLARAPDQLVGFAAEHDVRDILRSDDTQHLSLAVRREHQTLLLRQELARLRHQLQASERRVDSLMGKSRDAIAYVHEGMHIHANNVYCELFGIEEEDIEGLPLLDLITPDARKEFRKTLRLHEENTSFNVQVECLNANSAQFSATLEFSRAEVEDEPCTQIVIHDQSQSIELRARIEELTHRDTQTRLLNRQAFMENLEQYLNQETPPNQAGLIQISIKNFDELRDGAGIEAADRLLLSVAKLLQENMAGDNNLARFGDHDFILLHILESPLIEAAERFFSALRTRNFAGNCGLFDRPIFSVGVVPIPKAQLTAHELVIRSCRATKQAQGAAENELIICSEATTQSANSNRRSADTTIIDTIDHALETDTFQLLYQPVISLQGDTRENYSVLVRLLDKTGGDYLPETFWAQAKAANRLAEIDRWVVRHAIRALAKHRADGKKINFHICLSPDGISDDSMLLWVCDCLREFKARGAWLAFEFAESDLRSLTTPARKLVDGLKKINCRVLISRFTGGPGIDTLLRHFPVDMIKLSPDFLLNLANDKPGQKQLSEIKDQLLQLGVKTIAAGVEDANSLAILWNSGIHYIQGNFLQEASEKIISEAKCH